MPPMAQSSSQIHIRGEFWENAGVLRSRSLLRRLATPHPSAETHCERRQSRPPALVYDKQVFFDTASLKLWPNGCGMTGSGASGRSPSYTGTA